MGRLEQYRNESIGYKFVKQFAVIPRRCKGDKLVWMDTYYNKYLSYSYAGAPDVRYFQYRLTKEDAIVEKLMGTQ